MHRVEKLLLRAADRCRLPARAGAALLATLESIWCGGECSARCPGRRTGRIIPVRDALLLEELPGLGSPEDLVRAIKDYARVSVRGFLPVPDPPSLRVLLQGGEEVDIPVGPESPIRDLRLGLLPSVVILVSLGEMALSGGPIPSDVPMDWFHGSVEDWRQLLRDLAA